MATVSVVGQFVSGRKLSAAFFRDVVAPQLEGVAYSAALLGWGSDVLGYDTSRSTDHGWGPRLHVFTDADVTLELPDVYRGHPVRFGWAGVPARSWVEVLPLGEWLRGHLGLDATTGFSTIDWLLSPQQKLLGVVSGAVFADPDGQLSALREKLAWYPDQIWRWLLACQWHRLAQEEAFVARATEVGDTTGAVVIANRQVRELMRLALLQHRRYAPYQKWLGSAFAELPSEDGLAGYLAAAGRGDQDALGAAYLALATRHNASKLTAPIQAGVGDYYDRPARVIMADQFRQALQATVTDGVLATLPLIGSVDQVVDNVEVLDDPTMFRRLVPLYFYSGSTSLVS